jgi:hypothetical protein
MAPTTFNYRLAKASWAIAIDIVAEAHVVPMTPAKAQMVKERLWLRIDPAWLTDEESAYLVRGLRLVADYVLDSRRGEEFILIWVREIQFNPCHYQPEGLAAAMMGWAAKEFGFARIEVPVEIDRKSKRYVYNWRESGPLPTTS